jgi:hypothetical protein
VIGLSLASLGFAEGGGNEDWAEKAAVQYEEKAAKAEADGNVHDAAIYKRMAQIKRDAGAAAKAGKEFSWDEYHALSGQLGGGKKDKGDSGKDKTADKGEQKKAEDKGNVLDPKTEKKSSPGDGFMSAAMQYQEKAIAAAEAGDAKKAGIYSKLAKCKMEASAAANAGKDYDWTQYHELSKQLEE